METANRGEKMLSSISANDETSPASLDCIMLCCVVLCHVILCYVMLCHVELCYVMLCYCVILCCIGSIHSMI